MIRHLPNALTLLNLLSGCAAIICIFSSNETQLLYFFAAALLADFLDGFVARLLHVKSDLGKQLDSLADMVSFGVLPGAVLYYLLYTSIYIDNPNPPVGLDHIALCGFAFSAFAALRLARFNLTEDTSSGFVGLPTPAASIFVIGLLTNRMFGEGIILQWTYSIPLLLILTLTLSILMVSALPMFSLKFKGFAWRHNAIRYVSIILGLVMIVLFKEAGFVAVVALYVLYNVIRSFFQKTPDEISG